MDKTFKEFELIRTTITYERRFVVATDWEEAEEKGHVEIWEDWEEYDNKKDIVVNEV
tara:strand:- start:48 stop:218 length:171 start_codon:yes stop_codon:yes gene_type:complete